MSKFELKLSFALVAFFLTFFTSPAFAQSPPQARTVGYCVAKNLPVDEQSLACGNACSDLACAKNNLCRWIQSPVIKASCGGAEGPVGNRCRQYSVEHCLKYSSDNCFITRTVTHRDASGKEVKDIFEQHPNSPFNVSFDADKCKVPAFRAPEVSRPDSIRRSAQ